MFPYLNEQVKCSFRWRNNQKHLTRFSLPCRDVTGEANEVCPFALWTSTRALPPFQIRVPIAATTITSWKVYDLQGFLIVDLAADIPLLRFSLFYDFNIIQYFGVNLSQSLPSGYYESVIVANGVSYYSETFQVMCTTVPVETTAFTPITGADIAEAGGSVSYSPGLAAGGSLQVEISTNIPINTPEEVTVIVDGVAIGATTNGVFHPSTFWVTLTPSSTITFTAGPTFTGIIENIEISAQGGSVGGCFHSLGWTDCGNVGTVYYGDGTLADGWLDIFRIPRDMFVIKPSPKLIIEDSDKVDGEKLDTFIRKEVTYSINLDRVPWYLLDALTSAALTKNIVFYEADGIATDSIKNFSVDYTWSDDCLVDCVVSFQLVGEADTNDNCCTTFTRACPEPCVAASGIREPGGTYVNGEYYLTKGAASYSQYSPDGVSDPDGFLPKVQCVGKYATLEGDGVYFNGTAWLPVLNITTNSLVDANTIHLVASIWPDYSATIQTSIDGGATWVDTYPSYSAAEMAAGVDVGIPEEAQVRISLGNEKCVLTTGIAPAPPAAYCTQPTSLHIVVPEGESVDYILIDVSDALDGYFMIEGDPTVHASGAYNVTLSSGEYCLYTTDAAGVPNGSATYIYLQANSLTTLDVSEWTAATTIYLYADSLTTLDVPAWTAATYIYLQANSLTTLDVSAWTAATTINLYANSLTTLDVSAWTAATYIYLQADSLTTLDVSEWTAATTIYLYADSLTALDVSAWTAATNISLYADSLTTLDVSAWTAATTIYLYADSLTTLDVPSVLAAVTYVDVSYCPLDQDSVDAILAAAVANPAITSASFILNGSCAAPSSAGYADKTTLQGRGCTAYTN